jgi:hypothetical protein
MNHKRLFIKKKRFPAEIKLPNVDNQYTTDKI